MFRLENLRAREAGQSFFGMGMAYGILDRHAAAVTVEGQRFPLDRTDSALVIMVAIPASDRPRAVTTARIAVGAFPEDLWPKTSPSGDVCFRILGTAAQCARASARDRRLSPMTGAAGGRFGERASGPPRNSIGRSSRRPASSRSVA